MILELVEFRAPPGGEAETILAEARATLPRWRGEAELVRKHYVRRADGWLGGVYVWKSRAAAEKAHDAAWRAAVKARTGAAPRITCYELFMLLDNEAGTVDEWSLAESPGK